MKYYSTQRPIGPGTFPQPDGNKVLDIVNFDERQFVEEIGKPAWGWIEYEKPLDSYAVRSYELTPLISETRTLRYIGLDSWGRYVYEDETGKLWKLIDCCYPREMCEAEGHTPYSSSGNTRDGEPDCPMSPHIKPVYIS